MLAVYNKSCLLGLYCRDVWFVPATFVEEGLPRATKPKKFSHLTPVLFLTTSPKSSPMEDAERDYRTWRLHNSPWRRALQECDFTTYSQLSDEDAHEQTQEYRVSQWIQSLRSKVFDQEQDETSKSQVAEPSPSPNSQLLRRVVVRSTGIRRDSPREQNAEIERTQAIELHASHDSHDETYDDMSPMQEADAGGGLETLYHADDTNNPSSRHNVVCTEQEATPSQAVMKMSHARKESSAHNRPIRVGKQTVQLCCDYNSSPLINLSTQNGKHELTALRTNDSSQSEPLDLFDLLRKQFLDERESREVAEAAFKNEVSRTDEFLDRIRDRLDESIQFFGLNFPAGETIEQRVMNLSVYGKLYISRMYRYHFEKPSIRLRVRCMPWPRTDIPPEQHDEQLHDVLHKFAADVIGRFQELEDDLEAEKRRTRHVAKEMLQAALEANLTITNLRTEVADYVELCTAVKERNERHFGEGGELDQLLALYEAKCSLLKRKDVLLGKLRWVIDDQRAQIDTYTGLLNRAEAVIKRLCGADTASQSA